MRACAFGTPFSSLHPPLAPGQPHITRAQSLGIPTDCLGNECVARRGNLCYLLLLPHTTPHFHAGVWLSTIPAHIPTCTMALVPVVPIAKACVRTTHMARNFPWQHFTCGWKKFKVGNQEKKNLFVVRSRDQSRRRALLWANFSTAIAWAFMQAEEGKIIFAFLEASVRGKLAFSSILHAGKRTKPAFKKPGKNGGREKRFMTGIRGGRRRRGFWEKKLPLLLLLPPFFHDLDFSQRKKAEEQAR